MMSERSEQIHEHRGPGLQCAAVEIDVRLSVSEAH